MKSNKIVLILIFFAIGFVLYHKNDTGGIFGKISGFFKPDSEISQKENPYKAREKVIPDDIVDDLKAKVNEQVREKSGDLFDGLKDRILGKSAVTSNNLPEEFFPISQLNYELVRHKAYSLGYSEKHEQAAWTFHRLKKEYTYGTASRSGLDFMPDKLVSTRSALSSDYSRSGYDRGHLVPAGDFKCCQELMEDTFWVSNLSPEDPDFNRNMWNNLEQKIRTWARKYGELYIYTGPVLEGNLPQIGRYNKVSVPRYMYKIVIIPNEISPEKVRVKAFLIPNLPDLGNSYAKYLVSVNVVEARSGLDFMSNLPPDIEQKIEATANLDKW